MIFFLIQVFVNSTFGMIILPKICAENYTSTTLYSTTGAFPLGLIRERRVAPLAPPLFLFGAYHTWYLSRAPGLLFSRAIGFLEVVCIRGYVQGNNLDEVMT